MGDAGAMQRAQHSFRRAEIAGVAMRLGDMQRHAVDPAAHQRAASGKEQRRRDAERLGAGERLLLAAEQFIGERPAPPRHLVEAAQHGIDIAIVGAKAAALDGGKHVALEDGAAVPAIAEFGVVHARAFRA